VRERDGEKTIQKVRRKDCENNNRVTQIYKHFNNVHEKNVRDLLEISSVRKW
jgi:hypothetical protein